MKHINILQNKTLGEATDEELEAELYRRKRKRIQELSVGTSYSTNKLDEKR